MGSVREGRGQYLHFLASLPCNVTSPTRWSDVLRFAARPPTWIVCYVDAVPRGRACAAAEWSGAREFASNLRAPISKTVGVGRPAAADGWNGGSLRVSKCMARNPGVTPNEKALPLCAARP